MTGGMSMFQSELRSAVREARETSELKSEARSAPKLVHPAPQGELTEAVPRPPRAEKKRTVVKLWLPLTPLWLLLAPFALLLAPLLLLAPRMLPDGSRWPEGSRLPEPTGRSWRPRGRLIRAALAVHPYRTAFGLGAVLLALSGTLVEVDTPDALVRIRIF